MEGLITVIAEQDIYCTNCGEEIFEIGETFDINPNVLELDCPKCGEHFAFDESDVTEFIEKN